MSGHELVVLAAIGLVLGTLQARMFGYVKDDAFISLRYAYNVARGAGVVFNPGEPLEGYSNFLWMMVAVPCFWLGVDPLVWIKVLGVLAGQAGVVVVVLLARRLGGAEPRWPAWLAALAWATHPTVVLWSISGLEGVAVAVLCGATVLFALRLLESEGTAAAWDGALTAVFGALAALTRPEGHAVVLACVGLGFFDVLRQRRQARPWLVAAAIVLGVLVPYHLWRLLYFGSLVPNTFWVKGALGLDAVRRGARFVGELLVFAANPWLFALAALGGLVPGRRALARRFCLAVAVFFLLYLVKIGDDEMMWFRLYLPALTLIPSLAAAGLAWFAEAAGHALSGPLERLPGPRLRRAAAAVIPLAVAAALALPVVAQAAFVDHEAGWYSTYLQQSRDSFVELGRYVRQRSSPGDTIVFQDLGAAPFAAPDLRWVDPIGILDRTVARELAAARINPFLDKLKTRTAEGRRELAAFDARIRDYLLAQNPAWYGFVVYVSQRNQLSFREQVERASGDPSVLEPLFSARASNVFWAHQMPRDARFRASFRLEKHWMRNPGYWLVLYRSTASGSGVVEHLDARP